MNRLAFVATFVVMSACAFAQEVKYVEVGSFDALSKGMQGVGDLQTAKDVSGVVSSHAVWGKLILPELKLAVAIDSDKADAEKPSLLRLNFAGEGKFDNDLVVKATKTEGPTTVFGPAVVSVKMGDRTIPTTVEASYVRAEGYRFLTIMVSSGLQAKCDIGGKQYLVRLLDGQPPNFTYTDKPAIANGMITKPGDTVAVYVADEKSPGGRKMIAKGYYGQPIALDGKWYDVALSADGKKIEVAPAKIELGKVKAKSANWSAQFIGKKYVLNVAGSESFELPVDEYIVSNLVISSAPDSAGKKTEVMFGPAFGPSAKKVEVSADKVAELAFGLPLAAQMKATQAGNGKVQLSLQLAEASGLPVRGIQQADGKMPDPPKAQIVDHIGLSVGEVTLGYG